MLIQFLLGTWLLIALSFHSFAGAAARPRGKWEIRAPLPSARTEVAATELGGKIYVMGGYEKHGDLLEEYDPAKDTWRRRASLPRPLHHAGSASLGGKIYVIGGYISGEGPVSTVYEYDPAADQWRTRSVMPTARGALAVGVIAGKIYAIGGGGAETHKTKRRDALAL